MHVLLCVQLKFLWYTSLCVLIPCVLQESQPPVPTSSHLNQPTSAAVMGGEQGRMTSPNPMAAPVTSLVS